MENHIKTYHLKIDTTNGKCPIGEKVGEENQLHDRIPVISCEGACIRGEIARLAANLVSKEEPFARGCHGELFTVPHSKMANWIKEAKQVVMIDGCFLRCHGRVIDQLMCKDKILHFDALSNHKRYSHLFDIDAVPEEERKQVARQVADWVLESIKDESIPSEKSCCCS